MKLRLIGHEDRYAVEQLQLALFPLELLHGISVLVTDQAKFH